MWLLTAKVIFLFLGVFFTVVNIAKMQLKEPRIHAANFFWQTFGIVGFVALEWLI